MEEVKPRVVAEVKRVMVAIDESEASFYALEWALKNLGDSFANSEVAVFTAQPLSVFSYTTGFGDSKELKNGVEVHHKKTANALLEKARNVCGKFKIIPTTLTEVGNPKDAICDAVDNYNIGLLVVGSHGRGALKRAFLGSVSNYCVQNVKCPVMVVRLQA